MGQPSVTVREVRTPNEWRTLIQFPWKLYADDPNWVPPLINSQRRLAFDRTRNPAWEYMEGAFFIAWRGEQPVGTIGAGINHRHNTFHDEKSGVFGHFEVYDDPEAAAALLDTAAGWVRSRGMTTIRGPMSMTVNDIIGCLVDGFDLPPVLLMAYNPPYYGSLIEAAGFEKEIDLWAWYGTGELISGSEGFQKMLRIAEKQRARKQFTVRPGNVKELEREIRKITTVYQASWTKNWGYVPPTEREVDNLVQEMKMFYDSRLGYFAEKDGEPLGFILILPDFNQVLLPAYSRPGVPEWVTLLKAGWHWKIRPKINSIRVLLLGVREEYRGQGVDAMLMLTAFKAAIEAGYQHGEASWILENNDAMNRVLDTIGMKVYKTYRIYQKAL
jgi:GNAT superfamily N-acetyltransferase